MSDTSTLGLTTMIDHLVIKARMVLRDLSSRHALRQELLDSERNGSLDRILDDLELSRSQLERIVANYPLSTRLFDAMAARLGVDPAVSDPVLGRDLRHTCAMCAHQRECRHWLAAGRTEDYVAFCPNAIHWDALRSRMGETAPRQ